ncbi:MAG: caspase family protein [Elusimicrobia bacterium]|nr:caspase family protein [Elusimicrobiota bacterium]
MRAVLTALLLLPVLSGCGTPLLRAVDRNDFYAVREQLDKGADINRQVTFGECHQALDCALSKGHRTIAKLLIERGADVHGQGLYVPPIVTTARRNDPELVQLLLDHGARVDSRDWEGNDALTVAAFHGYWELVDLLLARSAEIDNAVARLEVFAQETGVWANPAAARGGIAKLRRRSAGRTVEAAPASEPVRKAAPAPDVDAPSYRLPERGADFAVVVGIEDYSALPPARFAARDAQAVAAHLKALGVPERNIALLTGVQATRTGLAKNIEAWLANNVDERSTVFFYYSGHGAPQPETGEAFLVPFDGDPEYLAETGYPLKRLYEKLGGLKAKRVIAVLDSCFSGAGGRSVLAKGTRPLVNKIDVGAPTGAKVVSLSASQASQVSGADEEARHGLFTYHLLMGLNGAAQDRAGGVTVKSLFDYLAPRVADGARRSNRSQTPRMLPEAGPAGQWRLR